MIKLTFAKTIRCKVITMTVGITLVITCIAVTVCYLVFQSFFRKNQIQTAEFNLPLVACNISSDMKDIIYLSNWCVSAVRY